MGRHSISQKRYLEVAQNFHWAGREHYQLWFTGSLKRHKRTEVMLPRLVEKKKLKAYRFGNRLVYTVPRRDKTNNYFLKIEHGLACTEGLVRIWRSNMEGKVISENEFRGKGVIPEWGITYPSETILLFEFCTNDNFARSSLVKNKMLRYENDLPAPFNLSPIVLFVIDVSRDRVKRFIEKNLTGERFFFTDYETFLRVPFGKQLQTPIYFWGEDGRECPLK